jgi:hypothetical protein
MKAWIGLLMFFAMAGLAVGQNAPLAQQKMCAEQAAKNFQAEWADGGRPDFLIYTSHFDPKVGTCYMLQKTAGFANSKGEGGYTSIEITDAFERRRWASFVKYGEDDMKSCWLDSPHSKFRTKCKNGGEFEDLAEKYFGISY